MTDLLLFRPPRRQPRLLVLSADKQNLALLTLDPWELRYAAKHEWPKHNCKLRMRALLNIALIRERPQAVVVPKEHAALRRLIAPVAKELGLPVFSFTTPDATIVKALSHLPACHCSQEVIRDPLLFQTHALAHAALSKLIQTAYAKQQLPTIGTNRLASYSQSPDALTLPRP